MRTLILFLLAPVLVFGQSINNKPLSNVQAAFAKIDSNGKAIYISKGKHAIPKGGHLQGIQFCEAEGSIALTASSSTVAYMALVNADKKVTEVDTFLSSPYRHAGGCQVWGNKLAVGVEDNIARNKSQVMLVDYENIHHKAVAIAKREGTYERSTAGATGITQLQNGKYLIAVADWDSRNIDFYEGNGEHFDSIGTYHAPNAGYWCAYQNINLLTDTAGNLFMTGLGKQGNNNRADLFSIQFNNTQPQLSLLSTRNFNCKGGASFRYAAGIFTAMDGIGIITSQRNLHKRTCVNLFVMAINIKK